MASNDNSERGGVLRVQIAGTWGVAELGSWLSNLDETYRLAATVSLLVDDTDFPYRYGWPAAMPFFPERTYVPPDLADLRALATARVDLLRVRSLQYESPGWVEVIGSWNPLKIVADAVAYWRSENTERSRQQRAFQLELLDRMPPAVQARYAATLLEQTLDRTHELALDPRVADVKLTEAAS